MRCHYHTDKEVGRVLIPICWPVVNSNDKSDCICPKPERRQKETDQEKIERLEARIKYLERLLQTNGISSR